MASGSSARPTRTQAWPAPVIASVTAMCRRSTPLPAPLQPASLVGDAKYALLTMHAHRLWIRLWIALGHPEENSNRPGGNARVTSRGTPAAHRHPYRSITASHSRCAQPQCTLAGRTGVIPGIHRPYDDYQSCNDMQIHIKVGKRPSGPCRGASPRRGPITEGLSQAEPVTRPDQIRRGDR
jgi:hypothetical protein